MAIDFSNYDYETNPGRFTAEEIITIRRMVAAGQPIFLAPIEIEIEEQLDNLHITNEELRTWRVGGYRYKVHLTPATKEVYDYLLADLRNRHSDAYRATRCQVPGKRGKLIRCQDKCSECPYGLEKEPQTISWDALISTGWEPEADSNVAEQAIAAADYAAIRARMDAEDARLAPLFEDYVLGGLSITELMEKYGLSRRRVFQLIAKAKEIGQR